MTTISSREAIARDAEDKAAAWVRNPLAPSPVNPFCKREQPDHYKVWRATFERFLLAYSAPECEASA